MDYLSVLLEQKGTFLRWTGSTTIQDVLGPTLSNFVHVTVPLEGIPNSAGIETVGFAYNPEKPDLVFPYFVVSWSDRVWQAHIRAHKKAKFIANTEATTVALQEKGIIQVSNIEKVKETQSNVLDAMIHAKGKVSKALEISGVSVAQHVLWKKNDEEYREALEIINEVIINEAEGLLLDAIAEGSESSAMYILNNKGHSLGYGKNKKIAEDTQKDLQSEYNIDALTTEEQEQLAKLIEKMEKYHAVK